MKLKWITIIILSICVLSPFFSGCKTPTYLEVNSTPKGADIFLNNKRLKEKTPAAIRLKYLPDGYHWLTVKKTGYKCTVPAQPVHVRFNPGTVVFTAILWWTPFPWIRIANDGWKGLYKPSARLKEKLPLFVLEKEPLQDENTKEGLSVQRE